MVDGTIVFSLLGLFDLCRKYGKEVVELHRSYKNADEEIKQATVVIETCWMLTQQRLDILQRLSSDLDDSSKSLYENVLQILYLKLRKSATLINAVIEESDAERTAHGNIKTGKPKAQKYALRVKESLQSSIQEMKEWASLYDPLMIVLARVTSKTMDQNLVAESLNTGSASISILKHLRKIIRSDIRQDVDSITKPIFCSKKEPGVKIAKISHSTADFWDVGAGPPGLETKLIVDEIFTSTLDAISDVHTLAKLLHVVDPFIFGILPCERVYWNGQQGVLDCNFAFKIPENLYNPRSLRQLLLAHEEYNDLNEKFGLAKQLAKSVLFVHSARFVHKNIRPETIIILEDKESQARWAFLIGFERFRRAGGETQRKGDLIWEKNLYRHPDRQEEHAEVDYIMQHDIYSLGVCLLEIGMGSSFANWTVRNGSTVAHPDPPVLAVEINSSVRQNQRSKAIHIKKCLVNLAEAELPKKMGRRYTDIVITCLTCLDQNGNRFGSEEDYYDRDGIQVGVRYIEKVFLALQEICI